MASRYLLLFSRAPAREAQEKGLAAPAGTELFEAFAAGWADSARFVGAQLVVASTPADRPAWRRLLADREALFVSQRGVSFGERLEASVREAAALGGSVMVVGGDVVPSVQDLARAFEQLESGADAVVAPAVDGGVSLVALPWDDLDLLAEMAPRRSDVFARLRTQLASRGRRLVVVGTVPDVDGRQALADLDWSETLRPFAPLLRRACARPVIRAASSQSIPQRPAVRPAALRGPPAA